MPAASVFSSDVPAVEPTGEDLGVVGTDFMKSSSFGSCAEAKHATRAPAANANARFTILSFVSSRRGPGGYATNTVRAQRGERSDPGQQACSDGCATRWTAALPLPKSR